MAAHHKLTTSPEATALLRRSLRRSARLVHLSGMDSETHADEHDDPQAAPSPGSVVGGALTLQELAAQLGVTVQRLYDLRSQGRGPRGFRVGRELQFRLSEIDAWLAWMEEADAKRHPRGGSR